MKKPINNNPITIPKNNKINLLETNIDFDEIIYFNHYSSVFGKLDFENPINEIQVPYLMSREYCYSYFEVRKNIKAANKESIPQILGRIKQFSSSLDPKFNMIFLDNIKSYSEILGIEQTKNILIPVFAKIMVDKIDVKIHFLKVLQLNFIDYLCSIGDEGISILRQNIIQIIQELYRDKNLANETLKKLLFKVFIKIAKSIIPKEKDKKDNYMLDLVMSFGYESNVSKEFYLDHKKICIKFIATLAEDFGQDWSENYLLPQIWFFADDEEEEIKKEVLIALPNLCQELKYEIIGTKVFKLIKKLANDKSPNIKEYTIATLAKIIKIYKEKSNNSKKNKKENENKNDNNIKLDPGSVRNFLGLIEKLILDKTKSVRDTIIEYIGEIINPLDKEELPQKLFDFYKNSINEFYYNKELITSANTNTNNNTKTKNDKKDEKTKKDEKEKEKKENVNYYFAYNFPAILYCYGKEVWPKLNSLFVSLCKEKDIKVRRSIIASFHEVSKIVGEKITEEELLPLYDNFLNSKTPLEKNFAIKNLPKILSGVNKEIKEKYFKYFDAVSIFQQNMTSKVRNFFFINWRNKIDVIEGILCYYHLYDKEIIYKSILPQCINFCFDDVYKVRSVSCKIFATLILYLYNENYKKNEIFELLELFALHKKYYQRICFVKMCKVLLENINLYNEKIKSLLYILVKNDKSNNVKVALSKSLSKVISTKKYKCVNEISLHKLCRILNNEKSVTIKNMFSDIKIKNCNDVKEEELFDLDDINKIIGNKSKIFDKDNSFIKKEFDFDINECQHKYPRREGVDLYIKKIKNVNNKKEENNINNVELEKNKNEKNDNKKEDIINIIKEENHEEKKEEEIKEENKDKNKNELKEEININNVEDKNDEDKIEENKVDEEQEKEEDIDINNIDEKKENNIEEKKEDKEEINENNEIKNEKENKENIIENNKEEEKKDINNIEIKNETKKEDEIVENKMEEKKEDNIEEEDNNNKEESKLNEDKVNNEEKEEKEENEDKEKIEEIKEDKKDNENENKEEVKDDSKQENNINQDIDKNEDNKKEEKENNIENNNINNEEKNENNNEQNDDNSKEKDEENNNDNNVEEKNEKEENENIDEDKKNEDENNNQKDEENNNDNNVEEKNEKEENENIDEDKKNEDENNNQKDEDNNNDNKNENEENEKKDENNQNQEGGKKKKRKNKKKK